MFKRKNSQKAVFYLFLQVKDKIKIERSCLQQYSLEEQNQSVRSPCRTKHMFRSHRQLYRGLTLTRLTIDYFWTMKITNFLTRSNKYLAVWILKFQKMDYLCLKGKQNMTFNLGAFAFSSTHWKSTIKVQDHPAELNIHIQVTQTAIQVSHNQL